MIFIAKNITEEKTHKCKWQGCILAVLTRSIASTQNVVSLFCFCKTLLFQKILAVNFYLPDVNQFFLQINWKRCFI